MSNDLKATFSSKNCKCSIDSEKDINTIGNKGLQVEISDKKSDNFSIYNSQKIVR